MTIPRELRDQICMYVLFNETNKRPELNESFEGLVASRTVYDNPRLHAWCCLALGLLEAPISNTSGLLLANWQLHAETIENISLFTKAATYYLDVIVLDEILLLPTWTHVPFLTTHLKQVNTTFRISGSYDKKKERARKQEDNNGLSQCPYKQFGRYKGFRIGNGAGPAITWQIYSVLERFIRVGPTGNRVGRDEHRHITIETLEINVETPPNIDKSRFGPPRSGGYRAVGHEERDVLDPEYLAEFILVNLKSLLAVGESRISNEWLSYGRILFEHVDHVVVKLDGQVMENLDIAEQLRMICGSEESQESQEWLKGYQEKTWSKRKQRGLKVLD